MSAYPKLGSSVDVLVADLDLLAVSAVRYALGRRSSIVDDTRVVCERVKLTREAMRLMLNDVSKEIERDTFLRERGYRTALPLGEDVDRESWLAFRDHLVKRLGDGHA